MIRCSLTNPPQNNIENIYSKQENNSTTTIDWVQVCEYDPQGRCLQ